MRRTLLVLLLLLPAVSAQASPDPPALAPDMVHVEAVASNQRVDLSWQPPVEPAKRYIVYVYYDGWENQNRTVNGTQASFLLTNGRTYVFEVAMVKADGTEGPRSAPVAATPRLENDLAYLAAGLIVVWLGIFGYAGLLARKEASLNKKLDRILQTRFEGRSP